MRRGGMGLQGLARQEEVKRAFEEKAKALHSERREHVQQSLDKFREHLELFARKHKDAIRKDPKFRAQFSQMCSKIGVDPLASNKSFWGELLGIGDYYFDLGVKITTISIATRATNGGMLGVQELLERLQAQKQRAQKRLSGTDVKVDTKVTEEDINKAVDKLSSLGSGLKIEKFGQRRALVSVPLELSQDENYVLEIASCLNGSALSPQIVAAKLVWSLDRSKQSLLKLAAEGLAWYDQVSDEYWFPALVHNGVRFDPR